MEFVITLTGTRPLIMHNARLADPLDPIVRAMAKISAKRKKTEDDHAEIGRLEFAGSLYLDPDIGPYVPGENIQRFVYDSAKLSRKGEAVKRGLFIDTDVNPLAYAGPRTEAELWADHQFRFRHSAKVTSSRVIRTRPIFRQWSVQAHGLLDTEELDFDDLCSIVERGGSRIGLGDWRPRYGQCSVIAEKA